MSELPSLYVLLPAELSRALLALHFGEGTAEELLGAAEEKLHRENPGDAMKWANAIHALPNGDVTTDFARESPRLGQALASNLPKIESGLRELGPWRKGPFTVGGVEVDAEWRSNLKFERIEPHVNLEGCRVLDVGSGNGYYCLRALGAGAKVVLGIDPTWLYVAQFAALQKLMPPQPAWVLPFTLEDLPAAAAGFDYVFSMGVLYHRRAPLDHLRALHQRLKPGGTLVLETLVIDAELGPSLIPNGRYAGMRNVWQIPSTETLLSWLKACGYEHARIVDITRTLPAEQRATSWSSPHSLINVLDANDPARTIEGYPGPTRAVAIANSPG
ncbi:MAG: tRNA 5-methoxyuridine(34)/uridine 5-oxyacetic acid(34) synthase CmoB [Polyangiaceae bacterium]|nr:tRNA 5-methoxyuridine(34)/uridine 5-oxyacetic acid(34) synthase CmoB [Polyangiaceae bacterium]